MIFCARSTSRSREQHETQISQREHVQVCLFYSQSNKILYLLNMADTEKITRCAKVHGLFFLDCVFWVLIGWAGKL